MMTDIEGIDIYKEGERTMITVEARTIEQVRNFATLVGNVCDMAEENQKNSNLIQLAVGYWKAVALRRDKLAEVLKTELGAYQKIGVMRSLEDLVEVDLITEQEAAFCRNWAEELTATPAK